MTDTPEYTVKADPDGTWRVYDPTGLKVSWYGPELDGDLAPTLARAEAEEKNFEMRFMAEFLGCTRQRYAEGLAACRAEVDARVAGGAL